MRWKLRQLFSLIFFLNLGHAVQFVDKPNCIFFTQNTFPNFFCETCHCLFTSEGQVDTYINVC